MPRINPVHAETADPKTAELLVGVKKKLGMVPNLISTMAQSTAVANAYLGFSGALAGGTLTAKLREQISLTVGQANNCDYCVAAHCALGKMAGLNATEVQQARHATAADEKASLTVKLMSYTDGYKQLAIYALIAGVLLIVISPVLRKLMHDVH